MDLRVVDVPVPDSDGSDDLKEEPAQQPGDADAGVAADELARDFKDKVSLDEKFIKARCHCGACSFKFFPSDLTRLEGHCGSMINCYCASCRRAHGAAFATYVPVHTSSIVISKGIDAIRTRLDRCGGADADPAEVRRIFCGECFSGIATLPLMSKSVYISAGALVDSTLPPALSKPTFMSFCAEEAPVYNGYVPAKKRSPGKKKAPPVKVTGGCACGACRFSLKQMFSEMQHCYCRACRRMSGAAWQTWLAVKLGDLVWAKQDSLRLVRTTSHARRHVCTQCGVYLTIVYDEDSTVWPLAGNLDDGCYTISHMQATTTDVSHICVKFKQSWWELPKDGAPRIRDAS